MNGAEVNYYLFFLYVNEVKDDFSRQFFVSFEENFVVMLRHLFCFDVSMINDQSFRSTIRLLRHFG